MCRLLSNIAVLLSISGLVAGNVDATNTTTPTPTTDPNVVTTVASSTLKTDPNVVTTVASSTPKTDPNVETTSAVPTAKPDSTTTKTTVMTTGNSVDPCSPDPCNETFICNAGADGVYTCTCDEGYQEAAGECVKVDPCAPNPCNETFICKPGADAGYTCTCDEGYQEAEGKCVTVEVDPCSPNPCQETFICKPDAEAGYTCTCDEGYQEAAGECVKECDGYVVTVTNTIVYYDVDSAACGNASSYPPSNTNVTVYFEKALVGTTVVANVTCNTSCVDDESNTIPQAIGVVECKAGGIFSTPSWIDCSKTELNLEEELTSAIIKTSNSDNVDEALVTDSVQVLEEVAKQKDVTAQSADDVLTVTNNLLKASSDDATQSVQDYSESITNSVQQVAEKVELEPADPTYSSYENQKSDIAMAVVQPTATARASGTYYYGTSGTMYSNLAFTNLELATLKPKGTYISVSLNAGVRASFVIYSDMKDLFPNKENLDILSKNFVYSYRVSGGEVTMRFPIKEKIEITSNNNEFNESKKLDCVRWTDGKWKTGSTCTNYEASNFYASCTCTQEGEYTIRADTVIVDEGLTPGAIAGIVIGSIIGVALIGGLAFYFYKKKQKISDVDEAT